MSNPAYEILICGSSNFSDDIKGMCLCCQAEIYFRPHAQHVIIRLCAECGRKALYNGGWPENVSTLPQGIDEIRRRVENNP